jgi:uncharacterized protein YdeI (YjbR/CyaY-like superfamily)
MGEAADGRNELEPRVLERARVMYNARRMASSREPKTRAKNRAEWRRWLAKNHASSRVVLLVYAKKSSGKPSVTYEESVEEALCFGWIDGVRRTLDEHHYTLRFTPRKPKSLWSKLNLGRFARLRKAGKVQRAGLATWQKAKRSGMHAKAYAVRDRVGIPSELRSELARSSRGQKEFEALPSGQRNSWCRWISWAKGEATRKRRAHQALRLIHAGWIAGETDAQAARRGIPSKARILGR